MLFTHRSLFRAVAGGVVALLCLSSKSQTTAKPKHPAAPAVHSCYSNQPPHSMADHLPPGYCGIDPVRLYFALQHSELTSRRQEFESTEAYNARLAAAAQRSILGSLTPSGPVAFLMHQHHDPLDQSPLQVSYDADTQAFSISVNFGAVKDYELPSDMQPLVTFMTVRVHTVDRSYMASNAMGVRVKVDEEVYQAFGAGLRNGHANFASFHLPVGATAAPRLKPLLAVALAGHLRAPWIGFDSYLSEATVREPMRWQEDKHVVVLEPEEFILFRTDTGEVLSRANGAAQ